MAAASAFKLIHDLKAGMRTNVRLLVVDDRAPGQNRFERGCYDGFSMARLIGWGTRAQFFNKCIQTGKVYELLGKHYACSSGLHSIKTFRARELSFARVGKMGSPTPMRQIFKNAPHNSATIFQNPLIFEQIG